MSKLGGLAHSDGVSIMSEKFLATTSYSDDDQCYTLKHCTSHIEKQPKWLRMVSRIPFIRGLFAPVFVYYQISNTDSVEVSKVKKEFGRSSIIIVLSLIVLFSIVLILSGFYFDAGLHRNLYYLFLTILFYTPAMLLMKDQTLKYHGAEHKAISCHMDTEDFPTPDIAKDYSRIHVRCGTNFIISLFVWSLLLVLLFPNISVVALSLITLSVGSEFSNLPNSWLITKILNAPGLLMQKYITTKEPEEKHLIAAAASTIAVLKLEQDPNIKLPEKFKDLKEILDG